MDQLGGRTEGEKHKAQIISVSKTLYPFKGDSFFNPLVPKGCPFNE